MIDSAMDSHTEYDIVSICKPLRKIIQRVR